MKHGCPRWQQSQNMAKSLSPKFWPHLTPRTTLRWTYSPSLVTVWPPKLYIFYFNCKRDEITDKGTAGQTDGQTMWFLDAPGGPFRPGHKNQPEFYLQWHWSFFFLWFKTMAKVKTDKQLDWWIHRHTEQEQYTSIGIYIIHKKQNIWCLVVNFLQFQIKALNNKDADRQAGHISYWSSWNNHRSYCIAVNFCGI